MKARFIRTLLCVMTAAVSVLAVPSVAQASQSTVHASAEKSATEIYREAAERSALSSCDAMKARGLENYTCIRPWMIRPMSAAPASRFERQKNGIRVQSDPRLSDLTPREYCYALGETRYGTCRSGARGGYAVFQNVGGKQEVIGSLTFEFAHRIIWDPKALTWTAQYSHKVVEATGTEKNGRAAFLQTGCAKDVDVRESSGPASERVQLKLGGVVERIYTEHETGVVSKGISSRVLLNDYLGSSLNIQTPYGSYLFDTTDALGTPGRCDRELSRGKSRGCINPVVPGLVVYDSKIYPKVTDVANHIYDAQRGLADHWGSLPFDVPVNRTTSDADFNKNRATSCGKISAPAGKACDEFSLASTKQGAGFVGAGRYSVRIVAKESNDSQGALTNQGYLKGRIINGDPFYIESITPDGRTSWDS